MRKRMIAPGFWENEDLGTGPLENQMLFAGLWCLADREGRFPWKPKLIRAKVFPYRAIKVEPILDFLREKKFIRFYSVDGEHYGDIPNFKEYQAIHPHEAKSKIPPNPIPIKSKEMSLQCNDMSGRTDHATYVDVEVDVGVPEGVQGEPKTDKQGELFAPEKPPMKIDTKPKYQLPDRAGNERKPMESNPAIWLSEAERALVLKKARDRGVREQFLSIVFSSVSLWFTDTVKGRKAYPLSSDHRRRCETWGIGAALKEQRETDDAAAASSRRQRAEAMNKAPLPGAYSNGHAGPRAPERYVRKPDSASPQNPAVRQVLTDVTRAISMPEKKG